MEEYKLKTMIEKLEKSKNLWWDLIEICSYGLETGKEKAMLVFQRVPSIREMRVFKYIAKNPMLNGDWRKTTIRFLKQSKKISQLF